MNAGYEDKAIKAVIEYEAKRGRKAIDARISHTGKGIDVVSEHLDIQVKHTEGEKPGPFWLSATDFEQLQTNPQYRIYFVYNLRAEPKVVPLKADVIRRHIIPEIRFPVRPSAQEWREIIEEAELTGELG